MRKISACVGVMLVSVVVSMTSQSPAAAGTCDTQSCGGDVWNESGMNVRIANNWCWGITYGINYFDNDGDGYMTPSCVTDHGSWYGFPSDVELPPNRWSSDYAAYYDTDAFRAYKGCVTKGYYDIPGPNISFTFDRRGKVTMWRKVLDSDKIHITSITC